MYAKAIKTVKSAIENMPKQNVPTENERCAVFTIVLSINLNLTTWFKMLPNKYVEIRLQQNYFDLSLSNKKIK
jgi:hypothetical protein